MYGTHSRVGIMLFIVAYVPAVTGPLGRIDPGTWTRGMTLVAVGAVLLAFFVTVASISWHGGGGAGEPLGCLTGLGVWAGRLAAPWAALALAPSSNADFWKLVGASAPPLAVAVGLWARDWAENRKSRRPAAPGEGA